MHVTVVGDVIYDIDSMDVFQDLGLITIIKRLIDGGVTSIALMFVAYACKHRWL